MKTKETTESPKTFSLENTLNKTAPKSLRPMRSLIAKRSFKPKTVVAKMVVKSEELAR